MKGILCAPPAAAGTSGRKEVPASIVRTVTGAFRPGAMGLARSTGTRARHQGGHSQGIKMPFMALGCGSCRDCVWDMEGSPVPSPSLKFPSLCDKGWSQVRGFQLCTMEHRLGPLQGALGPSAWSAGMLGLHEGVGR